jgi:hypothetical protein
MGMVAASFFGVKVEDIVKFHGQAPRRMATYPWEGGPSRWQKGSDKSAATMALKN